MSDDRHTAPRPLPDRPNLRHLKDQAKDLVKAGTATSVADAQFKIARLYGFPSWPRLKAYVDSFGQVGRLKQAIDANDLARVKNLMTRHPELHRAPLGYGRKGPLTWVAECRVPLEPPGPARLGMAKWMIENGSDVHQGGDLPLMRAALNGYRIPMMELLASYGADVNARCSGGTTRYNAPGVLEVLRRPLDRLAQRLDTDPQLVHRRFPELDCGSTGGRRLLLQGATLLHVAAEFGVVEAARLLLDRGSDVNARATVDAAGVGGQTAIFHAITQFEDRGLPMAQLLVEHGADLSVRVKLPGHYELPDEVVECTPLGYALRFVNEPPSGDGSTVAFLRERGAIE